MSYADIYTLAQDVDYRARLSAAAAAEGIDAPEWWAESHALEVAAAPGLAGMYASGVANQVNRPGWDAAVIPDAVILAAVQAIDKPVS